MNNICLTRCLVNGAKRQGNYIELACSAQVPTENNSLVNCSLFAYITEETAKNKRLQQIELKPGSCFKMSGKTVIDGMPETAKINMMIDGPRFIEYPDKNSTGVVKLFDVRLGGPGCIKPCANRIELFAKYQNTKDGPTRPVIICIDKKYQREIVVNTAYNVSGEFVLRKVGENILPVIYAQTFVKDVVLNDNVPVIIN